MNASEDLLNLLEIARQSAKKSRLSPKKRQGEFFSLQV
jgi:hypothetical protein